MPAPNPPALGGVNLSQLAAGSMAETGKRIEGAKGSLEASLASMLSEQGGMLASQGQAQSREQAFQRAQSMLAESLALRGQNLQDASTRAQAQYDASNAPGGANWYAQQRFQTDENIRQAKELGRIDRGYQKTDEKRARSQAERDRVAAEQQEMPRLSDFGQDAINPSRGQALEGTTRKNWMGQQHEVQVSPEDLAATSKLIQEYGADPNALLAQLRTQFGADDEAASLALWQLGYAG